MLKTCNQCHSVNFAKQQLQAGDEVIKNADHLMAEGIRAVAALNKVGVLAKPSGNAAYLRRRVAAWMRRSRQTSSRARISPKKYKSGQPACCPVPSARIVSISRLR
jgi:hypothetical protein